MLRTPTMLDHQFLKECYADWPLSEERGPITDYHLWLWIRRWMHRDDEVGLIAEVEPDPNQQTSDTRVGFVMYRPMFVAAKVDNLVVHPDQREKGYSKTILEELKAKLEKDGVVVATFDPLPGPFMDKYPNNIVTWDMEV